MKQKLLSIILSLSMVLSMLPATVLAAEKVNPEETPEVEMPSGAAETPETTVEDVQALIGALPAAEDIRAMDTDGRQTAYSQTQTAYGAYMALSEEQRGLVTGAGVFEELFAFFSGQVVPLAEGNTNANGLDVTPGTGWTISGNSLTIQTNGEYTITSYGLETKTQINFNAGVQATVTLRDVNIHAIYAAMNINGNANVTLMLEGDNYLIAGNQYNAGIEMNNSQGT